MGAKNSPGMGLSICLVCPSAALARNLHLRVFEKYGTGDLESTYIEKVFCDSS